MAAALECWSGRPSTDEDMALEQVLMKGNDRSEAFPSSSYSTSSSSASSPRTSPKAYSANTCAGSNAPPLKKWQNRFNGAISVLKNSFNSDNAPPAQPAQQRPDRPIWAGIVRNLAQLYPRNNQLPDRLMANLRRHFDALPNSYAQAGFDMKDIALHARLIEQAAGEDLPAVHIQEVEQNTSSNEGSVFKLTFACNSPLSWQAISGSLDSSSLSCKKIQIFEKKGLTLGVVTIIVQPGHEALFKSHAENALKSAVKRKKNNNGGVKLPFGLCGCQEESSRNYDEESQIDGEEGQVHDNESQRRTQLPTPLPESSVVVSIDEWQTVRSGGEEIRRWVLNSDEVEFLDWVGPCSYKGMYRGRKVWVKKFRGCEMGTAYEIEVRQDLLQLMSCGQRNIIQFCGICFDESHGLCVVMRLMEGGSLNEVVERSKRLSIRDVVKIALDVAEGLMFMNTHGVAYRDLNTQSILLDRQGNAYLGDMGVVTPCNNAGEVTEYETAGYRWLAPEIIAGDPESVTETWMSNVYSFGMILWEMVTGEEAYSSYSPVQAAVGIAACGLRPEIPKDCPQFLRSLMNKCWNNNPAKRPQFSEIISILQRQNIR
ncbi:Protein kinase superfamily protein [Rhynchospora pubera]|uniref:Protein kinase superfamily protein n=1 Tax=Rhynchospora pubera TaxID=906938 RepID=A0AAV8CGE5_9POAL|nr:Protein kinase superfamily protein [Rhynchospora pubera]